MFKKITLGIFVAGIFLPACKKDRTCSCTVTRAGSSTTQGKVVQEIFGFPITLADTSFTQGANSSQVVDKKMTKVTKKTGENNCVSYSQPYNEVTLTSVPASSFNMVITVTDKGEETYDCKLK